MGLLSALFGGKKPSGPLDEAMQHIRRLLEDEEFQLEMVHPMMKEMIKSGIECDKIPSGSGPFGYSKSNAIPTNGPVGELVYLSRLETEAGERLLFHRLGSVDQVDVFEAVTYSGREWFVLYASFYHPRKSRVAPDGLRIQENPAQLSGFNKLGANFPYDFVKMKAAERATGLSVAYIPIGHVIENIEARVFSRPEDHQAKIREVKSQLTAMA